MSFGIEYLKGMEESVTEREREREKGRGRGRKKERGS
jgi:hypothetical protein